MSISPFVRRTVAAVCGLVLVVGIADAGVAVNAERQLADSIRREANLPADPYVSLGGMAYTSSFFTGQWSSITVRARDLEVPGFGLVSVESSAVNVEIPSSSVWSGDFGETPAEQYFTRLQLDGLALGRQLDLTDLAIQNYEDISPAGGWETEAIFEATPPGWSGQAAVMVKLRIENGDAYFIPDHVITGPTGPDSTEVVAGEELSDEVADEILDAFDLELPFRDLPLRQVPTQIYVSGGSVFIVGDEMYPIVSPEDFLPVATQDPEFGGDAGRADEG